MNGNSYGQIFRVTTWGESHGPAVGVVIDGCPSGLPLNPEDFALDMGRRQGGQGSHSTPRKENDQVEIESGVFEGLTTGTPISLRIRNQNQRSADYEEWRHTYRPGHSDLTTQLKHGHRDFRGGGRSSARETSARVAAAVVAKKLLAMQGVDVAAWLESAGPLSLSKDLSAAAAADSLDLVRERRDRSPLALPGEQAEITAAVEALRGNQDSWGGSVRCRVDHLPPGLGEPVFDKLGALLAHGLMSLPAAVGFELGGGLLHSREPGSRIRDSIQQTPQGPRPSSNRHGGTLGGMSTGLPLLVTVHFHAPTSIPQPICSVDSRDGKIVELIVGGRHDAFPLPRAVPMVEAMVAITLADAFLRAGRIHEIL